MPVRQNDLRARTINAIKEDVAAGRPAVETRSVLSAAAYLLEEIAADASRERYDIVIAGTVILAMLVEDHKVHWPRALYKERLYYQKTLTEICDKLSLTEAEIYCNQLADSQLAAVKEAIEKIGQCALLKREIPFDGQIPEILFPCLRSCVPAIIFNRYTQPQSTMPQQKKPQPDLHLEALMLVDAPMPCTIS
ncbi:hypothetical protein ACFORL_04515 [Legionella dresdenensis]|uniref:Uncharacterized protein n=1 Tax=Legionella dresdenensis TaxID=450200 RepID=A0ABV8CE00_9GAMM